MAITGRDRWEASAPLWQWDTDRYVVVENYVDGMVANMACEGDTLAYTVEIEMEVPSGDYTARIPDELLQRGEQILFFIRMDGDTVFAKRFAVLARPKPDDYIYTPTEAHGWAELKFEIDEINEQLRTYLKPATDHSLGLVEIGDGIQVDANGRISVAVPELDVIPDAFILALD